MSVKIELGFTAAGVGAPFFTIGDATKGVIGNSDYVIGGGEALVDVSEFFQAANISRGKGRELERFDAGKLSAQFNNRNRYFDPTYEASPYYGQIVPKRTVKITVDNVVEFTGVVDDWNINYDPAGNSTASLVASDAFAIITNNVFTSFSPSQELSGARVEAALDNINWPADLRDIDTGEETLHATTSSGENALQYLTTVEQSELGYLFINKEGQVRFISRNGSYGQTVITFADDGSGVPYTNIEASYGSEFLYNRITLTSDAGTETREDTLSQATYGPLDYEATTFNYNTTRLGAIAGALLTKYKNPEYRFQNLTIALDAVTTQEKADLLAVELGDIVEVKFTPSGIPPAISSQARVIGIDQTINPRENLITFQLASIQGSPFIIGSAEFGIIGEGTIGF